VLPHGAAAADDGAASTAASAAGPENAEIPLVLKNDSQFLPSKVRIVTLFAVPGFRQWMVTAQQSGFERGLYIDWTPQVLQKVCTATFVLKRYSVSCPGSQRRRNRDLGTITCTFRFIAHTLQLQSQATKCSGASKSNSTAPQWQLPECCTSLGSTAAGASLLAITVLLEAPADALELVRTPDFARDRECMRHDGARTCGVPSAAPRPLCAATSATRVIAFHETVEDPAAHPSSEPPDTSRRRLRKAAVAPPRGRLR